MVYNSLKRALKRYPFLILKRDELLNEFNDLTIRPTASDPARLPNNTNKVVSSVEQQAARREKKARELVRLIDELNEQTALITFGLGLLDERSRALIEAMYFEGLTMDRACRRVSLTLDTARRLHRPALDKLANATGIHDPVRD